MKKDMSHQAPTTQKKSFGNRWWLRNQHLMKGSLVSREEQEGEPWRKVARDLSAWQGGSYLFKEKGQRVKQPKKALCKVSLEALIREIKVSPIRTPQKGKVSWELFEGKSQKKNIMRKMRKWLATNVVDTTLVLVLRVANRGNQWHIKNPRKVL